MTSRVNDTPATIRPIRSDDDAAAVASIIRNVMPEFGAKGPGFAINDPEVDAMSAAYADARSVYFVIGEKAAVVGVGARSGAVRGAHLNSLTRISVRTDARTSLTTSKRCTFAAALDSSDVRAGLVARQSASSTSCSVGSR